MPQEFAEQAGHRRVTQEMLEVVGKQEDLFFMQVVEQLRLGGQIPLKGKPNRVGDQRHDETGGVDGRKGDEIQAVGEEILSLGGGLDREAGLANPPGAHKGQHTAAGIAQQPAELIHFRLAADQRSR